MYFFPQEKGYMHEDQKALAVLQDQLILLHTDKTSVRKS
jgi:hypothetical protein